MFYLTVVMLIIAMLERHLQQRPILILIDCAHTPDMLAEKRNRDLFALITLPKCVLSALKFHNKTLFILNNFYTGYVILLYVFVCAWYDLQTSCPFQS